jgi:chorismate dehydratase
VKREGIRLGKVEYLNTIPVYYAWERGMVSHNGLDVTVVKGTPSELNRMLGLGKLDLSVVSCVEYAVNHKEYLLLPDLCIGAVGPVKSVLFLSKRPLQELDRSEVWITKSSLTSSTLVKFILEEDVGISPTYRLFRLGGKKDCSPEAMLLIGDEALKESKRGRYPFVIDLAQYWYEKHGLPFVFAVWCVRREVWRSAPDDVKALAQTLLASRDMGMLLMREIAQRHGSQAGLTEDECIEYLKGLSFGLSPAHIEGMSLFFRLIHQKGLIPEQPEIRFVEL